LSLREQRIRRAIWETLKKENAVGNRPYIIDELRKKSTYVIIFGYAAVAFVLFNFIDAPHWLVLLIMSGYGLLWRLLLIEKIRHSDYTPLFTEKNDNIDDNSEGKK
jgi:hypothetical protein